MSCTFPLSAHHHLGEAGWSAGGVRPARWRVVRRRVVLLVSKQAVLHNHPSRNNSGYDHHDLQKRSHDRALLR
ncbi:hypothetical protein WDZ92_36205 [Nostoc sp. NIES-2111]